MNPFAQACPHRSAKLATAIFIALSIIPSTSAQGKPYKPENTTQVKKAFGLSQQFNKKFTSEAYILGPGDSIAIELLDVPEYSGIFEIGLDGILFLPRLRSLHVEGLTLEELRELLTQKFSLYVHEPEVFLRIVAYRPIRAYIGGEVSRPGYYYLSGERGSILRSGAGQTLPNTDNRTSASLLPTVFDALRTAGGVTPFSKLSEVTVTRKLPLSSKGGKIKTVVDIFSVIAEGNESQNIRLFDGDVVMVARSPVELRDQVIKASQTNLSPDFISVFVSGRVRNPGLQELPQGASLDQAIANAGGQRVLRGQVEFLRFNRNGSTDKRKFFISGSNPAGSYKNPILMAGDVIRVNDSPLSATLTVLDEVTSPALGIYSIFNLFVK